MKKITLLLFLFAFNLYSQDLSKVDKIIFSYPEVSSIEELAKKIDYDFNSDIEKVKAIYTWLAINVDYYIDNSPFLIKAPEIIVYTDLKDLERRTKRKNEKIISEVFETRKAVCIGYALTFKKICDFINIENELIKGYVKTNPNQIAFLAKNKNHVWNTIKVNNKWILLDVTFGAGSILNSKWNSKLDNYYFNIKKEELNLTHYPSEKKWLDFMNQKQLKLFCQKPIFNKGFFLSDVKLLHPKQGKIIVSKRKDIELKLNGIKSKTEILYTYGNSGNIRKPIIKDFNSYTEVIINSPKEDANLNIYFNSILAIQYKVVVK